MFKLRCFFVSYIFKTEKLIREKNKAKSSSYMDVPASMHTPTIVSSKLQNHSIVQVGTNP